MASLLSQTTAEADARLINTIGNPIEAGFKLIRGWPWVAGAATSGDTIQALVEALKTVYSYTNPLANNKQYTGKFIVSEVKGIDENEQGVNDRACSIIQTLTLVKATITNVASLGTAIKMADRETLNYLGFQEGEKFRIYYRYNNIDPADKDVCMGLSVTAPTFTGFTFSQIKSEFKIEADQTGTFFVVFEADNWNKTASVVWATDKVEVGEGDTGGFGLNEHHQATGLSKSSYAAAFTAAKTADSNRVIGDVRLIEKANGEYQVDRQQKISYSGDSTATVTYVKEIIAIGTRDAECHRVWWRRTATARDTLIAVGGPARINFTYNSITYFHRMFDITDHGDGTFTVFQVGILPSGGSSSWPTTTDTYASNTEYYMRKYVFEEVSQSRKYYYKRFVIRTQWKYFATESAASNWVQDLSDPVAPHSGTTGLKGTGVTKTGGGWRGTYVCYYDVTAWTQAPTAPSYVALDGSDSPIWQNGTKTG